MARRFLPHFVGWFGITCPIVVDVLEAMPLPSAIKLMPAPYRNGLLASLACDLADRLRLGIALGRLDPALEAPNFDRSIWQRPLWELAAESYYLSREGCSVRQSVQPDVDYFCPARECPSPQEQCDSSRLSQYFRYNPPADDGLLTPAMCEKLLRSGHAIPRSERLAAPRVVSGRNFRLNDGPPYYLRNNDPVWWADFIQRVMGRIAGEAMGRWCSVRDRTNNLLLARRTGNFRKWDAHAAGLFLERMEGRNFEAEVYGMPKEDAEAGKIGDARETCRRQDDYVLRWFESKGRRANPYTRWLHRLVQVSRQSVAVVDWDGIKTIAETYVPPGLEERDDDLLLNQLCWCLSHLNPKRYPFRPCFSAATDCAAATQRLRRWCGEVRLEQWAQ